MSYFIYLKLMSANFLEKEKWRGEGEKCGYHHVYSPCKLDSARLYQHIKVFSNNL